jgi:hypothetical protein
LPSSPIASSAFALPAFVGCSVAKLSDPPSVFSAGEKLADAPEKRLPNAALVAPAFAPARMPLMLAPTWFASKSRSEKTPSRPLPPTTDAPASEPSVSASEPAILRIAASSPMVSKATVIGASARTVPMTRRLAGRASIVTAETRPAIASKSGETYVRPPSVTRTR